MTLSPRGLALIQSFEECELVAYLDPVDLWTVGWGHTGPDVREGLVWSQAQADAALALDVRAAEVVVNRAVYAPLNQNEFDALVSFVFNVGPGKKGVKDGFVTLKNGRPSSLLRLLNAGDYAGAAIQFEYWNKAGGRVLPGLTRRRVAESALFQSSEGV